MEWESFTTKNKQAYKTPEEKIASDMFSEILTQDEVEPYTPQLRGSSLPICILLHSRNLLKEHVRPKPANMDLYSEIGTCLHNLFQKKFMQSKKWGPMLFGNWECPKCKKIHYKLCTRPKDYATFTCECGEVGLQYGEVEAKYKGTIGIHVDTIIKWPNGDFWVYEYKTTSSHKIKDKKATFKAKHSHQGRAYPIILAEELQIVPKKVFIGYVNRERPQYSNTAQRQHKFFDITDRKILKRHREMLDKIVRAEAIRKKLFKKPSLALLDELDALRPCHAKTDYLNQDTGMFAAFEDSKPCPFFKKGGCFTEGRSRAAGKLYKELLASKNKIE